jgi:hypothetical protein
MPVQDNEMIAIIFPGEAIIVEGGKLVRIDPTLIPQTISLRSHPGGGLRIRDWIGF